VVKFSRTLTTPRLLSQAIRKAQRQGRLPLIADLKPISPRDGELLGSRDVADLARGLVDAGACAISVVTEPQHFGGSREVLRQVCQSVDVPVLQKDFFRSPEQFEDSQALGASAVLLILAMVPDSLAAQLYARAKELNLEVVVEIHSRQELERALTLNPTIIGINNRDILRLERDPGDVRVTEELAPSIPHGIVRVSESSLKTPEDIRRALRAGADAVLVGTAVLQARDPAAFVSQLTRGVWA